MNGGLTMFLRQLFDQESSTYTYLLADPASGKAALIDPVLEQVDRDLQLIAELGYTLELALDTHVHADHVSGSGALRDRTGAKVIASVRGPSCADVHVRADDTIALGAVKFQVLETPGHTDDSVSYLVGEHVFTGDALLIRGAGRTDFQNGDAGQLYESITRVLFALPESTTVHPGHDYKGFTETTIGEEKRHNARAAGRGRDAFIALMNGLGLPKPKKFDIAVPANRACGRAAGAAPHADGSLP
jgi:sulfur dioxygenase